MGFVFKFFLQDCYFWLLREHPFTTAARTNSPIVRGFMKLNYGQRPWREYPIARCADGQELIFIHIPKCGGTSVANVFGWQQVRHLSASVFAGSDRQRLNDAVVFALIRDPLERVASSLMHLDRSSFSERRERMLFSKMGITEESLHEHVERLFTDPSYQRIYVGTPSGRSGFSVSQVDFLVHHGELLVPNIFTLERIDLLEEWLSARVGRPLQIPQSNSSRRSMSLQTDTRLEKLAREHLSRDYELYDYVAERGSVCDGGQELQGLKELVRDWQDAVKK